MIKNLFLALINIILGFSLGVLLVEATLWVNSTLLFRGMNLPAPVDPPLSDWKYDVKYSDADAFTWRPDLIRPVAPELDRIESHVEFTTDEFGFRNPTPLPDQEDVVVLGRSISLGAHLPAPWPEMFAKKTGLRVLNLAEPGGDINSRIDYLQSYGLPRKPHWVILEVVPSIDIIQEKKAPALLSERMLVPLIQGLWRQYIYDGYKSVLPGSEIYPLKVDLSGRSVSLTCCLHYMEFFTLDRSLIEKSQDWAIYSQALLDMKTEVQSHSACMALLIAPTKPDIYFPLATHPHQLDPTVQEAIPYKLNEDGTLIQGGKPPPVSLIQQNAFAGREVVTAFAKSNGLALIDPTQAMEEAVLQGNDPFMVYDSHWNSLGHELVAREAAKVLQNTSCP
jgi:hypothetical protein